MISMLLNTNPNSAITKVDTFLRYFLWKQSFWRNQRFFHLFLFQDPPRKIRLLPKSAIRCTMSFRIVIRGATTRTTPTIRFLDEFSSVDCLKTAPGGISTTRSGNSFFSLSALLGNGHSIEFQMIKMQFLTNSFKILSYMRHPNKVKLDF